jgi:hypothetical protein
VAASTESATEGQDIMQFTDTASAGNGGVATSSANGGTAIADASGGDYNLAFVR